MTDRALVPMHQHVGDEKHHGTGEMSLIEIWMWRVIRNTCIGQGRRNDWTLMILIAYSLHATYWCTGMLSEKQWYTLILFLRSGKVNLKIFCRTIILVAASLIFMLVSQSSWNWPGNCLSQVGDCAAILEIVSARKNLGDMEDISTHDVCHTQN